jgi:hypothetical protein
LIGSTGQATLIPATYTAPLTNVLTYTYDIAAATGSEIGGRINGLPVAQSSAGTAGAGNFSSNPLNLFARNSASLWFGGYFYGLIVRGAASNLDQIRMTERYLNAKARAY